MNTTRSGLARFVLDNSLLLLAGTGAAVWANLDVGSSVRVAHPLHVVVNDIGMVFFFALAAKEVFVVSRMWRVRASGQPASGAECRSIR